MKLKKKIAILTTIAVLAVAAVGTTLALFTDKEVLKCITMGRLILN
jgi:predicted ribosomally synthesized peptide with SipW-like signal peptide